MNKIVVYVGKPGAGKGTRTEELRKRTSLLDNFLTLSTGQMLRDAVKSGSPLGKNAKSYLDAGSLVPDDMIIKIVMDNITQVMKQGKDIILDGFPRTVYQAKELLNYLPDLTINLLVFDISNEEVLFRAKHRRYCPNCGATYTDKESINPPKKDGICDSCGTQLIQRSDDKEEIVSKRLASYERDTMPVIAFLAGKEEKVTATILSPAQSLSQDPDLENFFTNII